MKIVDFEKIFFRLNLVVIAAVFVLLAPSTKIVASWYPDNHDILWVLPISVLVLSAVLWLIMCWNMPIFIAKGIFKDRRRGQRVEAVSRWDRFSRIAWPIITFCFELTLLILGVMCLIAFMRSETMIDWLKNVP